MLRTSINAQAAQALHQFAALHDTLTQLPNRLYPSGATRQHSDLPARRENGRRSPLCSLTSTTHKLVNDSWEHHAGDALLRSRVASSSPCGNRCGGAPGWRRVLIVLTDIASQTMPAWWPSTLGGRSVSEVILMDAACRCLHPSSASFR
ncbi:MAG: diguanylate cyclase [Burkholderiales bacterium]|nr:diguanylate cyclase [Burkholderiales bacterium]